MRRIILLGMALILCGAAGSALADNAEHATAGSSVNDFGAALYGRLAKGDGNLFCSPLSVYTVLSMVAEGARGETAAEMRAVLGNYKESMPAILSRLQKPDQDFELHAANALWAQNGFSCLPSYTQVLTNDYKSDFYNVDFRDPGSASQKINDWVSQQTSGEITDLFPPGTLPQGAKLVLTNAIYFHADWQSQFLPDLSSHGEFHLAGKPSKDCTFMHQRRTYAYFAGDQFHALELPYKGEQVGMIILLPKKVDGLAGLEENFSAKMLEDVTAGLKPEFVSASIPKFKFAAEASLPKVLQAMGIHRAFEAGSADFSGIDGKPDLFLSDVRHKAFVAVDEEGTTAAAATGGVMMPTAVPAPGIVFNADHPFIFMIVDHRNGAVLFVGRLCDPTAKN